MGSGLMAGQEQSQKENKALLSPALSLWVQAVSL